MAKRKKTAAELEAALTKAERALEAFRAWHRLDGSRLPDHHYTSHENVAGVPAVRVTVRGVSKSHGGVAWVTHYGQRCSEPIFVDDLINLWLGLSEENPLHAAGRALSASGGRWCEAEESAA
jgi:hypothetical protein